MIRIAWVLLALACAACASRPPLTAFERAYFASGGGVGGLSAATPAGVGLRE